MQTTKTFTTQANRANVIGSALVAMLMVAPLVLYYGYHYMSSVQNNTSFKYGVEGVLWCVLVSVCLFIFLKIYQHRCPRVSISQGAMYVGKRRVDYHDIATINFSNEAYQTVMARIEFKNSSRVIKLHRGAYRNADLLKLNLYNLRKVGFRGKQAKILLHSPIDSIYAHELHESPLTTYCELKKPLCRGLMFSVVTVLPTFIICLFLEDGMLVFSLLFLMSIIIFGFIQMTLSFYFQVNDSQLVVRNVLLPCYQKIYLLEHITDIQSHSSIRNPFVRKVFLRFSNCQVRNYSSTFVHTVLIDKLRHDVESKTQRRLLNSGEPVIH